MNANSVEGLDEHVSCDFIREALPGALEHVRHCLRRTTTSRNHRMVTFPSLSRIVRGVLVLAALAALSSTALAGGPPRSPNVVLILADDFGYECIGANGSTSYKTPNVDRLAAEGVRFERCYVQPLCTPTRVQLMTGKYN